jgi:hypothetical protein
MMSAAASAIVLVGVAGLPAGAAVSVPVPGVALPAEIDNPAFYEPQAICDPTPRPGAVALGQLLVNTYGPATIYMPRGCTSSVSEHFDGRAVDWMRSVRDPAQKEMADAFVNWLLAPAADGTPHEMARRMGIMYIIWNNQMIRMYDPGRGWTDYNGCMDPSRAGESLDNSCHRNHVHLSMSWDGAAGLTSWWSGVAQTLPYCAAGATSAAPTAGQASVVPDLAAVPGLVPVPATTILDTTAGLGAGLAAGCRMLAGRSLYPQSLVTGAPMGARWAAVAVTSQSNAPAQLVAWSAGAVRPASLLATPIGTTGGTLLVPIASDGTIGLGTTLGAARATAQVVGYVVGDPVVGAPAGQSAGVDQRPSKPRAVRARSARRAVTTRWRAPASIGSAPLVGYRVEALTSAKRGAKVAGSCSATPEARSCTISGLKRGKKYWMSVSVANAAGSTWASRRAVRVR